MKKLTIYGYARVSTQGQNLAEQTEQLLNAGVELKNLYREKQTGKTTNREAFQEVLGKLQTNDQLVITKLDRFARNTKEALEIIEPLLEKGVSIKVLNLGTIEKHYYGENDCQDIVKCSGNGKRYDFRANAGRKRICEKAQSKLS